MFAFKVKISWRICQSHPVDYASEQRCNGPIQGDVKSMLHRTNDGGRTCTWGSEMSGTHENPKLLRNKSCISWWASSFPQVKGPFYIYKTSSSFGRAGHSTYVSLPLCHPFQLQNTIQLELLWLLDCCFPQTMTSHPIAVPACPSPIAIDNIAHKVSDVHSEMKRRVIEVGKHVMKTGKTKPQWKLMNKNAHIWAWLVLSNLQPKQNRKPVWLWYLQMREPFSDIYTNTESINDNYGPSYTMRVKKKIISNCKWGNPNVTECSGSSATLVQRVPQHDSYCTIMKEIGKLFFSHCISHRWWSCYHLPVTLGPLFPGTYKGIVWE